MYDIVIDRQPAPLCYNLFQSLFYSPYKIIIQADLDRSPLPHYHYYVTISIHQVDYR